MVTTIPNDLKEQQRDSWKKWDSLVMKWLKTVGEKLIETVELRGDDQVLDCPIRTGESGLTAASYVKRGKIITTDLSEKMVAIANANAAIQAVSNYDACENPFP